MDRIDLAQLLGLAAALGFASGIRLYLVLFIAGLVGHFQWLELPHGLLILAHPIVLVASGLMLLVEFLADKIPAVDSLWDAVHTFVRIPAGAALAAAVFGGDHVAWAAVAAIAGGSLAATSHLAKAGARAAVNTSPEPLSNIIVSTAEDFAVGGLMWLALVHPIVAGAVVLVLLLLALWLLPKIFRVVSGVFQRLFGAPEPGAAAEVQRIDAKQPW
jgi:hypothetical protein